MMSRLLLAGLVLAGLSLVACSPTLRDDVYACTGVGANDCPLGFTCVSGRCRAPLDVPECRFDYECVGTDCIAASCEGGYCVRGDVPAPDGTSCRDGFRCNGDELCFGGTCQPGSPPCVICDEESGCLDCGSLGLSCCPGEFCFEGQCGPDGMCVTCGDVTGGPCCNDRTCAPGLICGGDDGGPVLCFECGDLGEFPCVTTGCNEGVVSPSTYLCTNYVECGGCSEGTLCVPSFDEISHSCQECGVEGSVCCPGNPTCGGATGEIFSCNLGYCVQPMVTTPGAR